MSRDCPQISFWKSVSWVSTHETLIKAKNVKEGGKKESCWVSFYVQSWLKFGKRRTYVPFGQCSRQHSHFILCQLHSLTGKQLMNNWWYWFHRKRVTLRLQVHLLTKKCILKRSICGVCHEPRVTTRSTLNMLAVHQKRSKIHDIDHLKDGSYWFWKHFIFHVRSRISGSTVTSLTPLFDSVAYQSFLARP